MRRIIITIIMMLISTITISVNITKEYDYHKYHQPTWEDQWDELLSALIQVESQGDQYARGSRGDWGILQITPIAVAEANRISGMHYVHEDAFDIEKSKEIFYIIARHYCPEGNYEKMARIWNGGPHGERKHCTDSYWAKVKAELES